MRTTNSSSHVPRTVPSKCAEVQIRKNMHYIDLQNELHRLRAVLGHETTMSHQLSTASELFPDPIDQAAPRHMNSKWPCP
jgi:hypothetical protein